MHEMTDHVDYRGTEYEAAADIGDLAAGGQILIGPKTYQRCADVAAYLGRPVRLGCCTGVGSSHSSRHSAAAQSSCWILRDIVPSAQCMAAAGWWDHGTPVVAGGTRCWETT